MEWLALLLFVSVILALLAGFPVAFTLGGTALAFAALGAVTGTFNDALLSSLPNRVLRSRGRALPRICSIRSAGCSAACAEASVSR
jgi:TRAP-type mannitol/chloroaromatic compound transport system permease large subunit